MSKPTLMYIGPDRPFGLPLRHNTLLRGAPILLLDEATSALDEATEERMLHNLMESRLVHTCLFVTHRPGTMRFCTRQYCVHDGEVVLEPREVP